MEHVTELLSSGTYYAWRCSCGRTSRHVRPYRETVRNARSHETKYNREEQP